MSGSDPVSCCPPGSNCSAEPVQASAEGRRGGSHPLPPGMPARGPRTGPRTGHRSGSTGWAQLERELRRGPGMTWREAWAWTALASACAGLASAGVGLLR